MSVSAAFRVDASSPLAVRARWVSWRPTPADVDLEGLVGPAAILARAVAAARSLLHSADWAVVSVENFKVLAPLDVTTDVLLTIAVERAEATHLAVSVVVRDGAPSTHGKIAALGVLRFEARPNLAAASPAWRKAREAASRGLTPVSSRFEAGAEEATLSSERLLGRVHELALVSAQGAVGGPAAFEAVRALSVFGALTVSAARRREVKGRVGRISALTPLFAPPSG